jgi:hypothetical protein
MSAGRIILLIFGILFILGSVPLLLGGGALLWVDIALKDDGGFFTTESYQLERDSYAIVTESAHIDIDDEEWDWGWGWFGDWDLGDLVTFKVEGSNRDTSKGIFIGVAEESGLRGYLNDVEYDEIIDFEIHDDELDVEYKPHYGSLAPADPTSQTFWAPSIYGLGTQTLEWELETGTYSVVLMNADGSNDVDVDVALGVKVPLIFGIGVGLLMGGVVALILGILMVIFGLRGRQRSQPSQPSQPMHIIKEV